MSQIKLRRASKEASYKEGWVLRDPAAYSGMTQGHGASTEAAPSF